MEEQGSDYYFLGKDIKPGLVARMGEYSVLEVGESNSRLVIATRILYRAGIVRGPEGDGFDLDMAIETVREHAIDPSLN